MTSATDPLHLLQSLEQTHGDIRAQAALFAEFLLMTRPEAERRLLRDALDAATVLRWFDDDLLGEVLGLSSDEASIRSEALNTLSFVERYQRGEEEVRYIHEATRLGWRGKIASQDPDRFRSLSLRAASCFSVDADATPAGRIECIYQLLCGDPELGASKLEELDRQWSTNSRSGDRYALATALQELENTQLVQGRARARTLLCIARSRVMRGEVGELAGIVAEALKLAKEAGDRSSQADARSLEGEVRQARNELTAAQAAFEESVAISRGLVEADRENVVWQRNLAVTLGRMGDVLKAQGNLEGAQAAFDESLAISQRVTEQDPSNIGWQQDLAIARGRMATTYEEKRRIFESHFLFEKLRGDEIDTLLVYSRVERYPAGREIFAKGSPGDSMMVVLRGTVKMCSVSGEGREIVLNIMNQVRFSARWLCSTAESAPRMQSQ
jgi:tetratricopeptide (TPR) repeat protein